MAGTHGIILFCRAILFIFLTLAAAAANIKTPLYERCGHFKQVNQSYRCLEYQNYGCQARKIPSMSSETTFCTTVTCPPDTQQLTLTHYRKQRYIGGADFTGLNISWAMDARDGSYRYLDGFRLKLSSSDLVYVIKMTVDVTQQPIDETSKMWFRFDCFYPVPKNKNWTLTVIQIPYDPRSSDVGALKNFTLDTNGDLVSPYQLIPTSTTNTPSTECISSSETSTKATVIETPSTSQLFPKVQETIYGHTTSINGVLIGVFSAVLVILFAIICLCFIHRRRGCLVADCKHWKIGISHPFRRKGNATSRPKNILNNTDNFNRKSERKLLLLYTEKSIEHIQRIQELSDDLGKLCQVIHLSSDQTKHNDYLRDLIEKANFIIIVSSDHTVKTVTQLRGDFLGGSTESACALRILLRVGEKISSRVVIVYYPEEKHLQILNSISMWCPVALPVNLSIISDWIQHGKCSRLIPATSFPDEETRSGQVCCTWSNTMDQSWSECTSVKCIPDSVWQDSGFQESLVCSWPASKSHARQADEVDDTNVCEKSFSCQHPCHTQSCHIWKQNPTNDFTYTNFEVIDSADNNQTHAATLSYPPVYSGYYKPPLDCNSINTDISTYVDAINS